MEGLSAVDHDRLTGDEVGARAAEVDDRADHVLGHLVALDRATWRPYTAPIAGSRNGCSRLASQCSSRGVEWALSATTKSP